MPKIESKLTEQDVDLYLTEFRRFAIDALNENDGGIKNVAEFVCVILETYQDYTAEND